MANDPRAIQKMEVLLEVIKEQRISAIPQLKTNPRMRHWYDLGFCSVVTAHGEALEEMLKGVENGAVQKKDESSGNSGEE